MTNFNFPRQLCIECKSIISNPICESCLAKDITYWMRDKNKKIVSLVGHELNKITGKGGHSNSSCISCHKGAFLCPYCFTNLLYSKMKAHHISKAVLLDFLFIFNFDFKHEGYFKDIEKLEEELG